MWRNTRTLALACALALCAGLWGTSGAHAADFAHDLAAVCKGEAEFALGACACVAANRLAAGQSETAVLAAFYAAPRSPTLFEVRRVEAVLTGYWPCNERLWFMWSDGDAARLGLDAADALLIVRRAPWCVLFFAEDALDG